MYECVSSSPAAVQSDWFGEVREAKRRLLLTVWWQKVFLCVCSWLAVVL